MSTKSYPQANSSFVPTLDFTFGVCYSDPMTEKDDALEQLTEAEKTPSISMQQLSVSIAQVHALLELSEAVRDATHKMVEAFSEFNAEMRKQGLIEDPDNEE